MRIKYKIIATSICFGLIVWVLDAVLDSLIFYERTFLELLIFNIPRHELYMRAVMLVCFLFFGIIISIVIGKRKKAEEELEKIFNLSQDMMGVCTPEGGLLRVNPSWEKILGYTQKELLDLGWAKLIHPDDVERTNKEVEKRLRGSSTVNFVNRYRCKDGSYKTLEWQAPFAKEGILHATARDITERTLMEKELQCEQDMLEKAQEIAHIGSWEMNTITKKIVWSKQMYDLLEVSTDQEPTFELYYSHVHPDDLVYVKEIGARVYADDEAALAEYRLLTPSGIIKYVATEGRQILDEKNNIIKLTGIVQDITERKKMEEALIESEEKLKAIVNTSYDFMTLYDFEKNKLLWTNKRWKESLGWSPEELKDPIEPCHPDDRKKATKAFMDIFSNTKQEIKNLNFRYKTTTGEYRYFASNIAKIDLKGKGAYSD